MNNTVGSFQTGYFNILVSQCGKAFFVVCSSFSLKALSIPDTYLVYTDMQWFAAVTYLAKQYHVEAVVNATKCGRRPDLKWSLMKCHFTIQCAKGALTLLYKQLPCWKQTKSKKKHYSSFVPSLVSPIILKFYQ